MNQRLDYPVRALTAPITPAQALEILADFYKLVNDEQLATAYAHVARGVAVLEETPRGELGPVLRGHLAIIVAEQQRRGEGGANG